MYLEHFLDPVRRHFLTNKSNRRNASPLDVIRVSLIPHTWSHQACNSNMDNDTNDPTNTNNYIFPTTYEYSAVSVKALLFLAFHGLHSIDDCPTNIVNVDFSGQFDDFKSEFVLLRIAESPDVVDYVVQVGLDEVDGRLEAGPDDFLVGIGNMLSVITEIINLMNVKVIDIQKI